MNKISGISSPHSQNQVFFFLLLFVLLYLVGLSLVPLTVPEAMAALASIDAGTINAMQHPFLSSEQLAVYPLFSYLAGFFKFFLGANEWSARLPSVIAVLAMCGMSGWLGRRYGGRDGGIVGAMTCACSFAAFDAGRQASGHAVNAALINAAWFAWFMLGREKRRWGLAWAVALSIVLLLSFHAGIKAFLIFYFPLFFLRRTINIWRRLAMARHLIMIAGAFTLCLFFQTRLDGTPITTEALSRWYQADAGAVQLSDFLAFPFFWAVALTPAVFLFWPGFCAAFRPLERDRQCGSFLRTIVTATSLAMWVIPNTTPKDLVIITPALSVLAGMHYEILMRRYRHLFEQIIRTAFRLIAGLTLLGIVVCIALAVGVVRLNEWQLTTKLFFATMICMTAILSWLALRRSQSLPIWLKIMLLLASVQGLAAAATLPFADVYNSEARDRGLAMRTALPENATVYRLSPLPLLREVFYLNRKVVTLAGVDELPEQPQTIYVLGGYDSPLTESRTWESTAPPLHVDSDYKPVFEWLPGRHCLLQVDKLVRRKTRAGADEVVVSIYRGVKKKTSTVKKRGNDQDE